MGEEGGGWERREEREKGESESKRRMKKRLGEEGRKTKGRG